MKPVLFFILMTSGLAFAQGSQSAASDASRSCGLVSLTSPKLEFDAASVQSSGPPVPGARMGVIGGPGSQDPGRVQMRRMTLSHLFSLAYGVPASQIIALGWMDDFEEHGFDVDAIMPGTTTKEQYCGMLRKLLADRFRLSFHSVTKNRTSYELVVSPDGPKFRPYSPHTAGRDVTAASTAPPDGKESIRFDQNGFLHLPPEEKSGSRTFLTSSGTFRLTFRGDMVSLARAISSHIDYVIVTDKTDLKGAWDIYLEFSAASGNMTTGGSGLPDPSASRNSDSDLGPTIFTAVERQLGLKLRKVKDTPVDSFVLDHAEKTPTDN